MRRTVFYLSICILFFGCQDEKKASMAEESGNTEITKETEAPEQDPLQGQLDPDIRVRPISHATALINWKGSNIYVDPVGGAKAFAGMPSPDFVLITDIHGDHLSVATLEELSLDSIPIIAPQAVEAEIPDSLGLKVIVLDNMEKMEQDNFSIEAIPMYNLREDARQFHQKGRGNGYVLEMDGKRLYIAGDTEDIPEMRNLKDIDIALIPMNLPYTMPVEAAADAVIEFQPKIVVPYHFRGQNGMSDVQRFKEMVKEARPEIEVAMLDWYPDSNKE